MSGGCVEGDVIAEAAEVMAGGRPQLLEFGVAEETAWRAGLPCGGKIKVLLEPLARARDAGYLDRVLAARRARTPLAVMTNVVTGTRHVFEPGTSLPPEVAADFASGESRLVETPEGSVFVQALMPPVRLIIAGGTNIGQVLADLGRQVGYDVIVVDPRGAFLTEERFAGTSSMLRVARGLAQVLGARCAHGRGRADARSPHRRRGAERGAGLRLSLHRRARLQDDARQAHRAPQGGGLRRERACAHPRSDRPSPSAPRVRRRSPCRSSPRSSRSRAEPRDGEARRHRARSRCLQPFRRREQAAGTDRRKRARPPRSRSGACAAAWPRSSSSRGATRHGSREALSGLSRAFRANDRLAIGDGIVDRGRREGARGRRCRRLHRAGRHAVPERGSAAQARGRVRRKRAERSIVYPTTPDGDQRNPVLWPRRFFPELASLAGAEGAKALLRSHPDESAAVRVESASLFADVDTPADLAALARMVLTS